MDICLLLRQLLKGLSKMSCQPTTLTFSFHTIKQATPCYFTGCCEDTQHPPHCHLVCQGEEKDQDTRVRVSAKAQRQFILAIPSEIEKKSGRASWKSLRAEGPHLAPCSLPHELGENGLHVPTTSCSAAHLVSCLPPTWKFGSWAGSSWDGRGPAPGLGGQRGSGAPVDQR